MLSKTKDLMLKSKFFKDTINTTFWSTLGKATGFLIPFFLATWFGISSDMDAFFFAYGLVIFISIIFASAIEALIVPFVTEAKSNKENISLFIGKILGNITIGLIILIPLFLLIIKPILQVFTRFNSRELFLVYSLLIEISPLILFLMWTSILSGALYAHKKFFFPAISPVFRAIINLAFIFLFREKFGVHSIALGYLVGEIVRLFVLVIAITKLNLFKIKPIVNFDSKFLFFFRTAFFSMISLIAIKMNIVVDKIMASWLETGSVSILHYAEILYMIPVAFMSGGILITTLSHWSERFYSSNSLEILYNGLKKLAKYVFILAFIISVFLISTNKIFIKLILGRGEFPLDKLSVVGLTWVFYLLGFPPRMLSQIYIRGFLILKKTKIMMTCAIYTIAINILLNYLLMYRFGIAGIALSTTFVWIFSLFYYLKHFKKALQ